MTELPAPQPSEFLLYETEDGRTRVECRLAEDTLWLSQAMMAELFQTTKQNIAKHLKAIFAEGELDPGSVVNQWLTTAADGKNYRVAHYSLDAILRKAPSSTCVPWRPLPRHCPSRRRHSSLRLN